MLLQGRSDADGLIAPPGSGSHVEAALSVREIDAKLCAPGEPFEIKTIDVDGRSVRIWMHAPRSLGEILDRSRDLGGGRDFLVLGEERVTHEEHYRRAARLASALVDDFGVEKGDRVAIAMRNIPEWSVSFFAAALAGAVAVPLNAFWNGAELAFALDDCGAKVLVADGERFERVLHETATLDEMVLVGTRLDDRKTAAALPAGIVALEALLDRPANPPAVDVEPDDPATIFYTSGTTSHPKGVLGTHRNHLRQRHQPAVRGRTRGDAGRRAGRSDPAGPASGPRPGPPVPCHRLPLQPRRAGVDGRHRCAHAEVGPGGRARPH
jgi:acyl-CoA synthetase (AMP-forming)/AMP-acid ligase II